jgi:hypothetical protein
MLPSATDGSMDRLGKISVHCAIAQGRNVEMTKPWIATMLAAAMTLSLSFPTDALAQRGGDYRWRGDRNEGWDPSRHYRGGNYRERRLGRHDRIYRGGDGRYYCRRNDGTTGLVIGALAGGLLGNAVGGNTLSTLLGAGGGALLGQSIDRGNIRCR